MGDRGGGVRMPIQIGAKPDSGFEDPIGMLRDCHRRIERFLGSLAYVAYTGQGASLSGEQATAVESALRYFRESAPRHTADEEESLFPRMREQHGRALADLDVLESQHEEADALHANVDVLFTQWLTEGTLGTQDEETLLSDLAHLQSIYTGHIQMEESIIFPRASETLSADDLRIVGEEFRRRRGVRSL